MPSTDALERAAPALAADLRTHDRTGYLALLFAPQSARPALTALAAYRAELARIVERAREPLAAEIRLQWWRDAIRGEGYGEVAGVPLADALREGMARYHWPADTLCAISEALIHDLYADPFATLDEFDGYAGETEGALIQLGAMALALTQEGEGSDGLAAARAAATAAGWAGVALAAADAVAGFRGAAMRARTRIPAALWEGGAAHLRRALEAGEMPQGAADAVKALAAHGLRADGEMRALAPALAPAVRPAFVRAFTAASTLRAAARHPLAVTAPGPLASQWRLWRAARRLSKARPS